MLMQMIRSVMNGSATLADLIPQALLVIIVVLFSLSFHEFSHAFIAYKMGDPTARNLGRLTLDPMKHLDPIGTLCMALFGFGWAKPVPVNSRYFKKPRNGMAITAVAGPLSNLLLSFIGLLILQILLKLFPTASIIGMSGNFGTKIAFLLIQLFLEFHILNLYLAVFNLLPIPPLDGSRILFIFLPDKYYFGLMKYERIIMLVLLALLWTGFLSSPLSWIANTISNGMVFLVKLIPGL